MGDLGEALVRAGNVSDGELSWFVADAFGSEKASCQSRKRQ